MILRHIYGIKLESAQILPTVSPPNSILVRSPDPTDRDSLITLIRSAYTGTIDGENGQIVDHEMEIDNYLKGEYGEPLFHLSRVAVDVAERTVSAVLSTRWGRRRLPLIAFVMTEPGTQGKRVAGYLLRDVVNQMKTAGETEIHAVVTVGNLPSERLFEGSGFSIIETITE
ncbi:MAG: N-acetyltransferase family protein [Candidatus Kapaibacterium sp.]